MITLPSMNEASCAFCILTWNSASYVCRCLDSVLSLPFRQVKVYIYDNGSTDGTVDLILNEYKAESIDGRLSIINAEYNTGTTVSRNTVLKKISSSIDYVCVLDSDTEVNAEAFKSMCAHYVADNTSTIGVMGPRMKNDQGIYQLSGRSLPTAAIKLGKCLPLRRVRMIAEGREVCSTSVINGLQDVGYLLSACWLFPYSTLSTVGLLDEKIFYAPEDVDWCARVHEKGLRVVLAHDAEIIHSYQRISRRKLISKINLTHISGLAHYFRKHHYINDSKVVWNPEEQEVKNDSQYPSHILFYTEAWGRGGIETFVKNVIPGLKAQGIESDIYSTWDWDSGDDAFLSRFGVRRFVRFPNEKASQVERMLGGPKGFSNVLANGSYDAVWVNTMNGTGFLYTNIAKRYLIKKRVIHSHNSDVGDGAKHLKRLLSNILSHCLTKSATHYVACSNEAGKHIFGDAAFEIIRNGIDVNKFRFDVDSRNSIREKLGIGSEITLIGNVGRINSQKNPLFQIRVFAEYKSRYDSNAYYLMIGKRDIESKVLSLAEELGVIDSLIILSPVENPAPYYFALDLMLMPSLYEGLGFVQIEAQCSGLPIISSEVMPREADITVLSEHCSLDQSPEEWAKRIKEILDKFAGDNRTCYPEQIIDAGFSTSDCLDKVLSILKL